MADDIAAGFIFQNTKLAFKIEQALQGIICRAADDHIFVVLQPATILNKNSGYL